MIIKKILETAWLLYTESECALHEQGCLVIITRNRELKKVLIYKNILYKRS